MYGLWNVAAPRSNQMNSVWLSFDRVWNNQKLRILTFSNQMKHTKQNKTKLNETIRQTLANRVQNWKLPFIDNINKSLAAEFSSLSV